MKLARFAVIAAAIAAPALAGAAEPLPPASGARNIVIVPDAFVDGSGWRVVHDILYWKGYKVTVVQTPHTSLDDDVTAARKVIFNQIGKVLLVGHGIGGTVISNVGTGDKVQALVYVAGLQPEIGETSLQLLNSMPAPGFSLKTDRSGYSFFDVAKFHDDYAADIKENRTNFMAISQVPITNIALNTPSAFAVWTSKPSYAIVATDDRVVSPDLQRWMYKRAHSKVTEIKGSHAVYISQPEEVAKVIEQAALSIK